LAILLLLAPLNNRRKVSFSKSSRTKVLRRVQTQGKRIH